MRQSDTRFGVVDPAVKRKAYLDQLEQSVDLPTDPLKPSEAAIVPKLPRRRVGQVRPGAQI